ncbi:FAD-dependent oxidoreductase [Alistipes sp.]|uniref:FAD-dependent oxidoreductase n=1 Tax=Alistipes sp. TaxID=1872444 RepID=UPI003AEFEE48
MAIDRREFLKLAGMGLAFGALSPALTRAAEAAAAREPLPALPPLDFDVAVVGAGPGGIPAAIAAAREGARVVLIEEDMSPGGAPVDMFVPFVCGGPRLGVFRELINLLNDRYDLSGKPDPDFNNSYNGKNNWWHPTSFQQAVVELIDAQPNLTLMCGVPVIEAIARRRRGRTFVSGVRALRNGALQEIRARVTVDATGTGLVAASAGCAYLYGNESMEDFHESVGMAVGDGKVQPCTWMFLAQKIRPDARFPLDQLRGSSGMEYGERDWLRKENLAEIHRRDKGAYLFWGTTIPVRNTCDPVEVAAGQLRGLAKLEHNIRVISQAGFSVTLAPKMGIREARRIVGDYVLTADDIIGGVMPRDKIADAHYSLDAWGMHIPEQKKHTPPYGIPYRCLTPRNTEGLLTAGRIISGTKIAHSSYRVQPICALIGEAAGTAAALCAARNQTTRGIDVGELQQRLAARGLFDYTQNRK